MRCFAALSMTAWVVIPGHAEPFGFAQDKLRKAESKHLKSPMPNVQWITGVYLAFGYKAQPKYTTVEMI
jgi:hypothetical protein